ncbi:hypothetical protein PQX77_005682 [Marasmius sp. AFHP31]|nr:hypothetical protein PQX77_005682 [Marasmius sp. AFHP31]
MEFEYANSNQLWIRPQTGQICLGPAGPSLRRIFPLWAPMPRNNLDSKLPPLPLSMYNNLTFLDRVVKDTPSLFVLDALSNDAWLSQAAYVFNVLGTPKEEWEEYTLSGSNGVHLWLYPDIDHIYTPFNHSQCVETQIDAPECYLFVLPPPRLPDTRPDVAVWRRTPPESLYYWSLDPIGDSVMLEVQRIALGLPPYHQSIDWPAPVYWKAKVYDLMQQWQAAQGFDSMTTDFAESMGYPILEVLPQDDNRFEVCVKDDEGSKPEPGLEGMEVDECFETSPNSQDFSLSREYLEEVSPMDVDVEDCSDLIANLHIEVTPMDE